MDTASAWPLAMMRSAVSGSLIRLEATTGIDTTFFTWRVTSANAARGTEVTMVGTRASCQPMPLLIRLAPAFSIARARSSTSSRVLPSGTRSITDRRYMMMKSSPQRRRVSSTISTGKRRRFSALPPYSSLRLLVRGAVN